MLNMIPAPYRLLASVVAFVAAALGLYWLGYEKGSGAVTARWELAKAKAASEAAQNAAQQSEAAVVEVIKYVDRVRVVREKAEPIIREVTTYVSASADAACPVPIGFVRVHDGLAIGDSLSAAGASDEAPSGVALSAVAETVGRNYALYHEVAAQLVSLQDYVTTQREMICGR